MAGGGRGWREEGSRNNSGRQKYMIVNANVLIKSVRVSNSKYTYNWSCQSNVIIWKICCKFDQTLKLTRNKFHRNINSSAHPKLPKNLPEYYTQVITQKFQNEKFTVVLTIKLKLRFTVNILIKRENKTKSHNGL